MIRIQTEDFNINEEIKLCVGKRSNVGGIATFIGVVRDFSRNKAITAMELTHYSSMAEKQMEKLRGKAIKKFGIINLTIVHRVGKLRPSDQIVGIVAAAGHRKEAFDACRFAIDELKKTVPIWKKEFTPNGRL